MGFDYGKNNTYSTLVALKKKLQIFYHFSKLFQQFENLDEPCWHLQMVNNIKSKLSFMEISKTYLWRIPFNFDVCSSLYRIFWLDSITSFCHTKGDTSGYAIKPKH